MLKKTISFFLSIYYRLGYDYGTYNDFVGFEPTGRKSHFSDFEQCALVIIDYYQNADRSRGENSSLSGFLDKARGCWCWPGAKLNIYHVKFRNSRHTHTHHRDLSKIKNFLKIISTRVNRSRD